MDQTDLHVVDQRNLQVIGQIDLVIGQTDLHVLGQTNLCVVGQTELHV